MGRVISAPGSTGCLGAGRRVPARPTLSLGYVYLVGFALIVPMTTLCAPIGARLGHAIDGRALRRAFALFLFLTGARMLYRVVF